MNQTNWKNVYQTSRVFRVLRNVSLVCFFYFLPDFRLRLLREEEAAQKQRQAGWTVSEAHGMPHPLECLRWYRDTGFGIRGAISTITTPWFMKDIWPVMEMGERQHFGSFRDISWIFRNLELERKLFIYQKTSFQTSMVFYLCLLMSYVFVGIPPAFFVGVVLLGGFRNLAKMTRPLSGGQWYSVSFWSSWRF